MIDDPDVRVLLGDARTQLATLPAESVQCIVTSPPFWGLRDYGTGEWIGGDPDCEHKRPPGSLGGTRSSGLATPENGLNEASIEKKVEGYGRASYGALCPRCGAERVDEQIGLEATPEEWCANLVAVMREARRVLRPDGVAWIEVGDTYADRASTAEKGASTISRPVPAKVNALVNGRKAKDLVGAPWMLAFALRADGWYLRSDTIWHRPNPMPESVTDRPTKAHSYVFLLSKSDRYFYDADAIREEHSPDGRLATKIAGNGAGVTTHENYANRKDAERWPGNGRNARSVWTIPTEPTPFAHFATMPTDLARRCIAAGTSEHGACGDCGAPWRRLVETSGGATGEAWNDHEEDLRVGQRASEAAKGRGPGDTYRRETKGWEASCEHDAERVPCTVLDPFMGAGTTALVARRMGRRAVGVELSAEYLEIARERLSQQSLFA